METASRKEMENILLSFYGNARKEYPCGDDFIWSLCVCVCVAVRQQIVRVLGEPRMPKNSKTEPHKNVKRMKDLYSMRQRYTLNSR